MKRQTWTDLSTFAAIAERGSFTAAAVSLGVTPSALSHAMRAMEERMGVRLLNRSTRSVAPTEAGERLIARLRPAIADLEDMLRSLEEDKERPAGRIRISAHRSAATVSIAPRLPAFAQDYPDVQVELAIEDGLVDIIAQGFDCGVRHEQVLENDMIAVRISDPCRMVYVATPDYWQRASRPRKPSDLLAHRCLAYRLTTSGEVFRWRFEKADETIVINPPARLISNDIDVICGATISGMGVACLLEDQVRRELSEGLLSAVLDDWSPTVPSNYLYYPGRRQISAAMRVFIDAMRVAPTFGIN